MDFTDNTLEICHYGFIEKDFLDREITKLETLFKNLKTIHDEFDHAHNYSSEQSEIWGAVDEFFYVVSHNLHSLFENKLKEICDERSISYPFNIELNKFRSNLKTCSEMMAGL